MSQDTQDFQELRRLLAFKRHEQPPPGYFNDFSRQVIVRIKAGERGEPVHFLERLLWEATWLQRLFGALEARPIVAGACGLAVCGLVVSGLLYSEKAEVAPVALVPTAESSFPATLTSVASSEPQPFIATPALLVEPNGAPPAFVGATANGSLLGDLKELRPDRAKFTFPSAN